MGEGECGTCPWLCDPHVVPEAPQHFGAPGTCPSHCDLQVAPEALQHFGA